ncbi:hypothetical protein MASR2M47_16800 [Draconibacterium sp.]
MKLRKLLRILHRDFGYFIVGMTIVYALSGIYLNHRHDFNPDYKIFIIDFKVDLPANSESAVNDIKAALKSVNDEVVYKKHYLNNAGNIKVFIENGEAVIDPETGEWYNAVSCKNGLSYFHSINCTGLLWDRFGNG